MNGHLDKLVGVMKFAFHQRFKKRRIADFEGFVEFLSTRSAYIAQTSLYGYLKTRMGTQFRQYFEDDGFSKLIHESAVRLFVSCLADLTVYGVARLVVETGVSADDARDLALRLFQAALPAGLAERDRAMLPFDALERFEARLAKTSWVSAAHGELAFQGSVDDLIYLAPVTDEFKALDRKIVRNSIRFRWRDVREQLRKRLAGADLVQSVFSTAPPAMHDQRDRPA